MSIKVLTIIGTRPEAIKLSPVIRELASRQNEFSSVVCLTAQHREMLDQVVSLFQVVPNYDLDLMRPDQSLNQVTSLIFAALDEVLRIEMPDWVLVQGDTTTAFAAAIASFYRRVRVAHVEAGLRTSDKWHPFPEEVNRRGVSVFADLHFAPTQSARENLIRENIDPSSIHVTGNTVIDALKWFAGRRTSSAETDSLVPLGSKARNSDGRERRSVLVTAHRRESHGEPIREICRALKDLALKYEDDLNLVYPVHPNPNIQGPVHETLSDIPNVHLLPPLEYDQLVGLLKSCYFVVTDSGGLQEEAPGLGKPVLVLRERTERPEGIAAGTARLVGTQYSRIMEEVSRLMDDTAAYKAMATAVNPYGDGFASQRIATLLLRHSRLDAYEYSIEGDGLFAADISQHDAFSSS